MYVRAIRWPGERVLLAVLDRRFVMLVSVPSDARVRGCTVAAGAPWRPRLRDVADEMVLATAVNGTADRLVTFNLKHLGEAALESG